jgi:hypothetical protein
MNAQSLPDAGLLSSMKPLYFAIMKYPKRQNYSKNGRRHDEP